MSMERICGRCDFFVADQDQLPRGLMPEAGKRGLCLNPMVAVNGTFEEWSPIVAIRQSYYRDEIPYWVELDGICFKSKKDSETYLYLPLDSDSFY